MMKQLIKSIPIVGDLASAVYRRLSGSSKSQSFPGSAAYWEQRYAAGGDSGAGSYNKFAEFKAEVLNSFVSEKQIQSVIEFGCGDGNQLTLAKYPEYLGVDVSQTAVNHCREKFRNDAQTIRFCTMDEYDGQVADLSLSLDVIYHLIEDEVFEKYMRTLFAASRRYVVVYASNTNDNATVRASHVKHRKFTDWVQAKLPEWRLFKTIPNKYPFEGDNKKGSFADFFFYEKA